MSTPRQTLSYLTKKFAAAGLRPDSRRGQNFLIDLNLVEVLADEAELTPSDVVLEVGTGTGSLTALLASRAGYVVSLEVDTRMHQLARESLIDIANISLLVADILKNKNRLQPSVMEAVGEVLAAFPDSAFKLVANLPYHIATPLVSNLLLAPRPPDRMVVTIQKELADRMTAVPRTKDYSALSVWIQSFCQVDIVRVLPPSVFWPRPKVYSAIIKLIPDRDKLASFPRLREYNRFLRAVFLLRRKFLRSVVVSVLKPVLDKPVIDGVLQELGYGPQVRAEELPVAELERLFHALYAKIPLETSEDG